MSIGYVTGDLFMAPENYALAHGVNCAGAMGRGIAVEFKRLYPEMYEAYKRACGGLHGGPLDTTLTPAHATGERLAPGSCMGWYPDGAGTQPVYNLATQTHWRAPAKLEHVEASLVAMCKQMEQRGVSRVAMPRVGCGLGRLEWRVVRGVIERVAAENPGVMFLVYSLAGQES